MEIIIFAGVVVYFVRTIFFLIGVVRQRIKTKNIMASSKGVENGDLPFVSVVIPARNEEKNIKNAVLSVDRSTYPKDKYEIVVVNDRSEDRTGEVLEELKGTVENLKVVAVNGRSKEENLQGKAGALQHGIENARGELILMTDADCEVHSGWIESIAKCFSRAEIGIVPSFTLTKVKTWFDKIQSVEWVYMSTMAMGGVGMNVVLGCYGNNLSVRRDAFFKVGGYRRIKFSVTEDLALMKAVFDHKYEVLYLLDERSAVETLPCSTFKEYLRQHKRWAIGGLSLGWKATAFVLTTLMFWGSLILSVVSLNLGLILLVIFCRYFLDFVLIYQSLITLRRQEMWWWVLFAVPFFAFMELIAPFLVIDKTVHWKGQKF